MFQIFKQWLIPFAVIIATQISVVRADSIRVVGPNGQIQSAPTFSEPLQRAQSNSAEPSRFYGPTRGNETLWSIASKLRPDNSVSVQQTLLAIYRLNPQAFENQNIHSLLPASHLRVPSLEQARASSTQQAINIMNSHLAKLDEPAAKPKAAQASNQSNVGSKNSVPAKPAPAVETAKKLVSGAPSSSVKEMNKLEKQLELSESELLSLEEKNHQLRLMLSDVQSEVDVLKTELSDEDRIRSEVEKLLAEVGPVFRDSRRSEAEVMIRLGRQITHRADGLLPRIANSSFTSQAAVSAALTARFYKRIVAHTVNILSTVIMPIHKIDFFDEEEIQRLSSPPDEKV